MVFKPIYILILFLTIVIDYYAGIWIAKSEGKKRKNYLIISLISNIGILAIFKYYNFFNTNISSFLNIFDKENPIPFLNILLPIGLSFHTFQAMSYTIEVYRKNQEPEKHFGIYALYVMFYPQLVAGPIERPQNVLHQFKEKKYFDWENVKSGLMLIAFGLFKKVVIADRLAIFVDFSYNNITQSNGLSLLISSIFFAFQIYCDFSGYSDIAIGTAKIMGFNLMLNFDRPYQSKTISEFWRRWHISLSTWFRDYLYISLGGNRVTEWRKYFNLFFVFMVSGFWHGANWTFVIWGSLHGLFLIVAQLKEKIFKQKNTSKFSFLNIIITFCLADFAWIFFRANNVTDAFSIIQKIATTNFTDIIQTPFNNIESYFCVFLILILIIKEYFVHHINTKNTTKFITIFSILILICYFFGVFNSKQFIYFQF